MSTVDTAASSCAWWQGLQRWYRSLASCLNACHALLASVFTFFMCVFLGSAPALKQYTECKGSLKQRYIKQSKLYWYI